MMVLMSPGFARRRLGELLQRAREERGLTMPAVVAHLQIARARMYRIEAGEAPIRRTDAAALCEFYQVTPQRRDGVMMLVEACGNSRNRRDARWPLPEWLDFYPDLEATAESLRIYAPAIIPDLLQTPPYATELLHTTTALTSDDIGERVNRRMTNRETVLLTEWMTHPTRIEAILDEAVLHRPLTQPGTWTAQLADLAAAATLGRIDIRVIPAAAGLHPGLTTRAFTIMAFRPKPHGWRQEPDLVHCPGPDIVYDDHPNAVAFYHDLWKTLSKYTLDPIASATLISQHAHLSRP